MRRITAGWTILVWAGVALHDLWQFATFFASGGTRRPKPLFEPFHSLMLCTIGITLAIVSLRRSRVRGVLLSTAFTSFVIISIFPRGAIETAMDSLDSDFFGDGSLEPRVVLAIAGSLHVLAIFWLLLAALETRMAFVAARSNPASPTQGTASGSPGD